MMKKVLLVFMFGLLTISNAKGPSYKDTVEFIYEKVNTTRSDGRGGSFTYNVKVNQCSIETKIIWKNSSNNIYETDSILSFPLKNLDPSSVKLYDDGGNNNRIELYTKEHKENVIYFIKSNTSSDEYKGKYFKIRIYDNFEYNAPKVAKAFRHLIDLCGGKGELF